VTALKGFRIVELSNRVVGEYAAKLLADFGAEVIKVEPTQGAPTRSIGPFVHGNSTLFNYLNTNKRSITLDLAVQREALDGLLAGADALIMDQTPDWAAEQGMGPSAFPHLVHCHITPFGQSAPANWQIAEPINVMNAGGWGYHSPSETAAIKPPLKGAGRFMSDFEAGLEAALATIASLWRKRHAGPEFENNGQFIDISEVATQISRADSVLGRMLAGEQEPGPERTRYDMGGPGSTFACADGHVFLVMTTKTHWLGLCQLMAQPDWISAFPEDWLEYHCTAERVAEFREHFSHWLLTQAKDDVSEAAQKLGVALVQVNTAADLPGHPQYIHRGYFQSLDGVTYPTVPYHMSASPVRLKSAAPPLSSDSARSLNWTAEKLPAMSLSYSPMIRNRGGPLSGVRVLEITKVWAGPYAGKLLAFLGAEVIKVESLTNLDEMRAYGGVDINSAPYFLSINQEVQSVQVNMKSDEGLDLLRQMIAKSDILLDNLRPGAMERLGLGYEEVRQIKPDIIQVSIKMYGTDGPLGYQTGYAPCFAALGGLTSLVGHEGEAPKGMNIRYGDSTVGASAAFATIAALHHRATTGDGQFIDVSAVEAMSSMIGDSLFAFGATGDIPHSDGNHNQEMRIHGCFPCVDGEWISIAVSSERAEQMLRSVLAKDDSICTEQLATYTSAHDASELADRLRQIGIPAFKSASSLDLVSDGFLWDIGVYRMVTDGNGGIRPIVGPGWRLTPNDAEIGRAAPQLGEHNNYVYATLLGLTTSEIEGLKAREAIQ
jgi:crotonobetainyl-CoA:carnitine CoA-transferase CaiB-like acyl-CoA transferase